MRSSFRLLVFVLFKILFCPIHTFFPAIFSLHEMSCNGFDEFFDVIKDVKITSFSFYIDSSFGNRKNCTYPGLGSREVVGE